MKFCLLHKYIGPEPQVTFLSVPSSASPRPEILVSVSDFASAKVDVLSDIATAMASETQIRSRRFWLSLALWCIRPQYTLTISKQQQGKSSVLTAVLETAPERAAMGKSPARNGDTEGRVHAKVYWVASSPEDEVFESAKDLAFWVITQLYGR